MFNNCGAIEAFTVAEGNPVFAARGGHLVCIGGTHNPAGTVILIRGANVSEIPDGVNVIGKAAFRRATLAALTIPASVTVIENYAFSDSSILTVNYKGTEDAWQKAICDENGKERMWKSSKQEITVKCSYTVAVSHILVAYFSAT